ncbi:GNAT family N-acetyltransferase [Thiomicrospira microaerophila]|nr:GNAT family N-acetyltransferase [Thiomicrospira microaerophila]
MSAPAVLSDQHDLGSFCCGHDRLDYWLKREAMRNQKNHGSKTFVITCADQVVGYYALAAGSVERQEVSKTNARNMPDTIPVIMLGRLAMDKTMQGKALLKDALFRSLNVANEIAVKAALVHAIYDQACRFYQNFGFKPLPGTERTLMLPISHIQAAL